MGADLKASKFGGSSVATADMIRTVRDIVRGTSRRAIVVSAPGTRFVGDVKVTDLLERWADNGATWDDPVYQEIESRFIKIYKDLDLAVDLQIMLCRMQSDVASAKCSTERLKQFVMSRGEWINAQIVAHVLGYEFIDAADFISFDEQERYNHEQTMLRASAIGLRARARDRGIVVPGYYGSTTGGFIVTFPRDGSDISGSIVAALTDASVYENFTDVDGFLATSPKIVENPERIIEMTFKEARELAFMGSPILQPHAVKYAMDADIPIHVRKTDTALRQGTWIRPFIDKKPVRPVTGIAMKKGVVVSIEKYGMDEEDRFLARTADVFADHGVGIHNCPGSVDSLSFIVFDPELGKKIPELSRDLERVSGAEVRYSAPVAVICIVGRGMMHAVGVAARITHALASNNINIVMLNQGASELNVEVGVDADDGERAVRALYAAFFGE